MYEDVPRLNEPQALARMVRPGARKPGKYAEGVIQIWVTRACNRACYNCTQGSQLALQPKAEVNPFITPEQFETAVLSTRGYHGVIGVFGGNPALHPEFPLLCEILRKHVPYELRGLWCNDPIKEPHGRAMAETFNPAHSNLNVHLDDEAARRFRAWWPGAHPIGQYNDSRHSPPYVAMRDVLHKSCPACEVVASGGTSSFTDMGPCPQCDGTGQVYDEELAWSLIANCDINRHWSAMIGVFRGELRAWFCEIAGAQAMLHQTDPRYPDTGVPLEHPAYQAAMEAGERPWWDWTMDRFAQQVRIHCHSCGVPLRGHGELATAGPEGKEQVSAVHREVYRPKVRGRTVELVTTPAQLGTTLPRMTDYLGNATRS